MSTPAAIASPLRLKDKHSPLLKSVAGLHGSQSTNPMRSPRASSPMTRPSNSDSQNVLGDPIKLDIVGYVLFFAARQEYRWEAKPIHGHFVSCAILTSGKETYPASRFLDTDLPKDGPDGKTVQLDFNKAYNPPCATTPTPLAPFPCPPTACAWKSPPAKNSTSTLTPHSLRALP